MSATAPLSDAAVAASRDVTHPQFHFSLGQVLATVMLGSIEALSAEQNQSPTSIGNSITGFVDGFLKIWLTPPPAPPPA